MAAVEAAAILFGWQLARMGPRPHGRIVERFGFLPKAATLVSIYEFCVLANKLC